MRRIHLLVVLGVLVTQFAQAAVSRVGNKGSKQNCTVMLHGQIPEDTAFQFRIVDFEKLYLDIVDEGIRLHTLPESYLQKLLNGIWI